MAKGRFGFIQLQFPDAASVSSVYSGEQFKVIAPYGVVRAHRYHLLLDGEPYRDSKYPEFRVSMPPGNYTFVIQAVDSEGQEIFATPPLAVTASPRTVEQPMWVARVQQ